MKTVLVFGTFDGLHPGHLALLRQARALGDKVVVSLASDEQVRSIKGRVPVASFGERRQTLLDATLVDDVIESDHDLNSFHVIELVGPDVIALGYDQNELGDAVNKWLAEHNSTIEVRTLDAFEPDRYKSSLLR